MKYREEELDHNVDSVRVANPEWFEDNLEKRVQKFCRACGREMASGPARVWDRETGEQKRWYACPSLKCDHDGVDHDYVPRWFGIPRCSKCGQQDPLYFHP